MKQPLIVLSSSSSARRGLMERLQLPFVAASPHVDETPLPNEIPYDMVQRLAILKAETMAVRYPTSHIIGCDQVGIIAGTMLTKPLTHEKAFQQLRLVSGKMVRFLTGMCLFNMHTQQMQVAVEPFDVYFRDLSDALIESYLRKEKPFHCAGSFHAEGLGIALIEKFAGDDYTALIGLPLIRLTNMLSNAGVEVL